MVRSVLLVLALLLVPGVRVHAAQELIDGIAAVVNGEIISIGEVRRAAALLRDAPTSVLAPQCGASESAAGAELKRALECLIDQRLVFREVRRFPQLDIATQPMADLWQQVIVAYPDPSQRDAELARIGLTEQEVRDDLLRQAQVAAYVDQRFRATVDIPLADARAYFDDVLVPEMLRQGIEIPLFEQVGADYVVPILREREVNRRIESWVADLRERATITRRFP